MLSTGGTPIVVGPDAGPDAPPPAGPPMRENPDAP
jgi:hypothetical protein